ncbi:MAG: cell division protein FtsZ [Candidatus Delongbacteria bacterium]|nr:cell division protein FtsZ [Candidatus Delongbacteria bacterium]MBN2836829.1 cell division protein FtsZ [Candidatus Delongbacteria bacterium]
MSSSMIFDLDDTPKGQAKIKIIGIGGGGCNAIDKMIDYKLKGVEFIAINTDAQALKHSKADVRIQIGLEQTRGLGAGGDAQVGMSSVEEDEARQKISNCLAGSDMVFIAAGMGGGTGTGASSVVAGMAQDLGALTVAVVTKPFHFEGKARMKRAEDGIVRLREKVDTLIVIPNERLISLVDKSTIYSKAFELADNVLYNAAKSITDLINNKGVINRDFADVRTTMKGMGDALMGVGEADGEHRCVAAAQSAVQNTLLENVDITGAKGVLVYFCGNSDITMYEINDAMKVINDRVGEDANIFFGLMIDQDMGEKVRVSIIATGFDNSTTISHSTQKNVKETDILLSDSLNFQKPAKKIDSYFEDEVEEEVEFVMEEKVINENLGARYRLENFDLLSFEKPAYYRNKRD